MMEIYDIVDMDDEIIGAMTRDELRSTDAIHRSVVIIVLNRKNEILIQKRSHNLGNPGKWSLVAGHVDSGETYDDAAKRELSEEMFSEGIPHIEMKKLFKTLMNSYAGRVFFSVYSCVYDGVFTPDKEEVEAYEYQDLDFLLSDITSNPDRYSDIILEILTKYKRLQLM